MSEHDPFPWILVKSVYSHLYETFPEDYRTLVIDVIGERIFKTCLEIMACCISRDCAAYKRVYPNPDNVYTALRLCPVDRVRVIIVGQDPYIREGQAHGLAFSVQDGFSPPSLKRILCLVKENLGEVNKDVVKGDLSSWAHQGVLLLNSILTVREGESNSHAQDRYGWETITQAILKGLMKRHKRLVLMLWGRQAQNLEHNLDVREHKILRASHPSPLGCHSHSPIPFVTMRHFVECNEYLEDDPIRF